MELDYFINQAGILPEQVIEKYNFPATGLPYFDANTSVSLLDSTPNEDFSLFFTLNHSGSGIGDPRHIFGNYSPSLINQRGGFVFGLTDNHELFITAPVPMNTSEQTIFSNIRLGEKNCLALVRGDNAFTLYKYDPISAAISSEETFAFGGQSYLNSLAKYSLGHQYLWYGEAAQGQYDQLVYFNSAFSKEVCEKVFSGFLPFTLFDESTAKLRKIDEEIYSNLPVPTDFWDDLSGYFEDLHEQIATNSGGYVGFFDGAMLGGGTGRYSGFFGASDNDCLPNSGIDYIEGNFPINIYSDGILIYTGEYIVFNGIENPLTYNSSGSIPINYSFSDSLKYYYNSNGEIVVSHKITAGDLIINYDAYLKAQIQHHYTLSGDLSYFDDFAMNGVAHKTIGYVSPSNKGDIRLETVSNEKPVGFNNVPPFDRMASLYTVEPEFENGRVYYNDNGLIPSSQYTVLDNHIDLIGITEVESIPLIYDMGSGAPVFKAAGESGKAAEGDYFPNASIVTDGAGKRFPKQDYLETCPLHLIHNKGYRKTTLSDPNDVYLDYGNFWQQN